MKPHCFSLPAILFGNSKSSSESLCFTADIFILIGETSGMASLSKKIEENYMDV